METEFNLSERIVEDDRIPERFIPVFDVKEFIKRLKEEIGIRKDSSFDRAIDKLAGDKLTDTPDKHVCDEDTGEPR